MRGRRPGQGSGDGTASPPGAARRSGAARVGAVLGVLLALAPLGALGGEATGPLKVLRQNPGYFTDGSGRAVYLTGAHTWTSFQDIGFSDPPPRFDYGAYLDFLEAHHHNFFRLWVWEQAKWVNASSRDVWVDPLPFIRTGPGLARDGKEKFDLTRFNEAYFSRLRDRVAEAGRRGIYVAVMLFNGWSIGKKGYKLNNPWDGHPFNRHNNVNGIDGDPDGNGEGRELHGLGSPDILRIQERYIARLVDTLNDLPNLLWEVSNESPKGSREWQYHVIRSIKRREAHKPAQHPVGMTAIWPQGRNEELFDSPADWVSPSSSGKWPYKTMPPANRSGKVIILDSDHLWGLGGSRDWVWKSFLRGMNPVFMDPYSRYNDWIREMGVDPDFHFDSPLLGELRRTLGHTRRLAGGVDLARMRPCARPSSTAYCMATDRREFLVYLPGSEAAIVDLGRPSARWALRWFSADTGEWREQGLGRRQGNQVFESPFKTGSVLHIRPRPPAGPATRPRGGGGTSPMMRR